MGTGVILLGGRRGGGGGNPAIDQRPVQEGVAILLYIFSNNATVLVRNVKPSS